MAIEPRSKTICIVTMCILSIICSIVILALAISYRFSDMGQNMGHLEDYPYFSFIWLLIVSVLGIISSLLGIFTAVTTKRGESSFMMCCFQGTFGVTHLITAMVLVVFGFLVIEVASISEPEISTYCYRSEDIFRRKAYCAVEQCENRSRSSVSRFDGSIVRTIDQTDFKLSNITSEFMCSQRCPCDISDMEESKKEKWL